MLSTGRSNTWYRETDLTLPQMTVRIDEPGWDDLGCAINLLTTGWKHQILPNIADQIPLNEQIMLLQQSDVLTLMEKNRLIT